MKQTYSKRIAALESACGQHAPVDAVHLVDVDEVVVLSQRSHAEHERLPRAVFEERYPTGRIVKAYGQAWMWEAV